MEELYKKLIEGTEIKPEIILRLLEEILKSYELYYQNNEERDEYTQDD